MVAQTQKREQKMIRHTMTLITLISLGGFMMTFAGCASTSPEASNVTTPVLSSEIAPQQDSLALENYVGSYEQPNIDGTVRVRILDGRLAALVTGRPPIPLTHESCHTFRPDGMPDAAVTFDVKDGRAVGYTFTSSDETNVATRVIEAAVAVVQDATVLAPYLGSYDQPNITGALRVRIIDGRLTALVSGRPPISMTHVSDHTFRPDSMPDATITFDVEDGRAVGYAFRSSPEEKTGIIATRREEKALKPSDAAVETRAMLEAFVEDAKVPGMSVAIAVNGNIVFSEAFGMADIESGMLATPQTRFRIASISKSLTGTAAALLAERGELDLEAPISTYLPDYPAVGQSITPMQLATHMSGIRHYKSREEIGSTHHYPTLQSALEIFAEDDLLFEPGTDRYYTTFGYTALGAVMEAATDRDFATLMREDIFEPLGMRNTVVDDQRQIIPNRSGFYAWDDKGAISNAKLTDHSYKIPGGGFLSTAEDLVRFGSALLQPGFLKQETLDQLFGNSRFSDGTEYAYGMGWTIKDEDGRHFYGHGGNQPGARCYLLIYPDSGLVLAAMGNMYNASIGRSETQVIAEPFDRIARGIMPQAPVFDPAGVYELKAKSNSTIPNATLQVWEMGNRWTGSLSFEGRSIRMPMVWVSGNEMRCLGFDRRIIELDLNIDGAQITGTSTSGSRSFDIEGIKVDYINQMKEPK